MLLFNEFNVYFAHKVFLTKISIHY